MHQLPFGKHRNKSLIDVLAADPSYCDWLAAEPWFGEKFPILREALRMMVAGDYTAAAKLPPQPPRRRGKRRDQPSASEISASIALYSPSEEIEGGCRVYRPLAFARR